MNKVNVGSVTLSNVGVEVSQLFQANGYVNTVDELTLSDGAWVIVEVLRYDVCPFALFKLDGDGNFEIINLEIVSNLSEIRDMSLADYSAYVIASEYPDAFVELGRYSGKLSDCLSEANMSYDREKYERTYEVEGKTYTDLDLNVTMLDLYSLVII